MAVSAGGGRLANYESSIKSYLYDGVENMVRVFLHPLKLNVERLRINKRKHFLIQYIIRV